VTLHSATKSFNIAGLRTSIAHFGAVALKERLVGVLPERLLGRPGRTGVAATIAAWCEADAWLDEVMRYLDRNRHRVAQWAARANLGHHLPEATYLAWIDCRRLVLPKSVSPQQHFLEHAKVGLTDGADFGSPGRGHIRLNFATSEEILEELLKRLTAALG